MPINFGIQNTAVAMADCMKSESGQKSCALIVGCTAFGALSGTAGLVAAKYGLSNIGGHVVASSAVNALVTEYIVGASGGFGFLCGSVTAGLCFMVNKCCRDENQNEDHVGINHNIPPGSAPRMGQRDSTDDFLNQVTSPRSQRLNAPPQTRRGNVTPRGDAATSRPVTPRGDAATSRPVTPRGDAATSRPVTPRGDAATSRPVTPRGDAATSRPVTPIVTESPARAPTIAARVDAPLLQQNESGKSNRGCIVA